MARYFPPLPRRTRDNLALLLADTDGTATATSGLGVLSTHTETPVVTETAVGADTLETLEILTGLAVEGVGDNLGVLAIGDVALSVQEPCRDLILGGVLEDGDHTLEFFGGKLTSTVGKSRVSLLLVVLFPFSPIHRHVLLFIPSTPVLHLTSDPPPEEYSKNNHKNITSDVPLGEVNIGLLADQVGVTATNTLDLGQGDHDLLLAVNIGVEQTQDVLEVRLLVGHERCIETRKKS